MVRQNIMTFLRNVSILRENKRFRTNSQSRLFVSQLCTLVWLRLRTIPENSPLKLMPLYTQGKSVYHLVKRFVMLKHIWTI
jgi:hypothetical protein